MLYDNDRGSENPGQYSVVQARNTQKRGGFRSDLQQCTLLCYSLPVFGAVIKMLQVQQSRAEILVFRMLPRTARNLMLGEHTDPGEHHREHQDEEHGARSLHGQLHFQKSSFWEQTSSESQKGGQNKKFLVWAQSLQSRLRNTDWLLANRRATSPQMGYYSAHRRATSLEAQN